MNPDGTIAGAPGLNLTDGNGRIIPVNLSVSIPVLSSAQVSENDRQKSSDEGESSGGHSAITSIFNHTSSSTSTRNKVENDITMMNDDSGQITPRQSNSSKFFVMIYETCEVLLMSFVRYRCYRWSIGFYYILALTT